MKYLTNFASQSGKKGIKVEKYIQHGVFWHLNELNLMKINIFKKILNIFKTWNSYSEKQNKKSFSELRLSFQRGAMRSKIKMLRK